MLAYYNFKINFYYIVTGKITIKNNNPYPVEFNINDVLNDGTVANIAQSTNVVPVNDSVILDYTAKPDDASATLNTATVSVKGQPDVKATAAVSFTENIKGDDKVVLGDARVDYSKEISATTSVDFPESFKCSADSSMYVDGVYKFSEKNIATLIGDNTDLEASATVDIECRMPVYWGDETAWAYGDDYAIPIDSLMKKANWGWTNGPLPGGDYEWDIYAGAAQNDISKGMLVGKLIVEYNKGCVTVK